MPQHIRESKLDNGNIGLEITYGGRENPFGGVDAASPPMYIDRNCFTDANNFGIFDEQLCAVGWFSRGITFSDAALVGAAFLGHGWMYQGDQYLNWALFTKQVALDIGPPYGITYRFYMCTWPADYSGAVATAATVDVRQLAVGIPALPAMAQIIVEGGAASVAGSATITVTGGAAVPVTINLGDTPAVVATSIATAITAAYAGTPCTAAVDSKFNNRVNLITSATGSSANYPITTVTVTVTYVGGPTIVFPVPVLWQNFNGGVSASTSIYGVPPFPISWVQVGNTLYIGGRGTMILQYSPNQNPPLFEPLTQYLGAINLAKYNGQLIAAGIVPGPGQVIDQPERIIAWSAPNAFGVWEPEYSDGTVTGAGFNEETDFSDYLTGIFITPGAAVILHSQGIDYITPLSGGVDPFDFVHITNALKGESCQDSRLVTQYDQLGYFIGNANIFAYANGLGAIGDKIKDLLLPAVSPAGTAEINKAAASGIFFGNGKVNPLIIFTASGKAYLYTPNNKAWMISGIGGPFTSLHLEYLPRNASASGTQVNNIFDPTIAIRDGANITLWTLKEQIQNADYPYGGGSWIVFPQEEIAFGRDITIESIYASIAGTPGLQFTFSVSGTVYGILTLPGTASETVFANYQIYFNNSVDDKLTIKNPQLRLDLTQAGAGVQAKFTVAKVAMFGSYDPFQRPV